MFKYLAQFHCHQDRLGMRNNQPFVSSFQSLCDGKEMNLPSSGLY